MITRARIKLVLGTGLLLVGLNAMQPEARGQAPSRVATPATREQPDAQQTQDQFSELLEHYPPTLKSVLALDPTLLGNEAYLAPYPDLAAFLASHPEIARDPAFYLDRFRARPVPEPAAQVLDIWKDVLQGVAMFMALGLAAGLIVWLTRTLIDSRRWTRMAKVQTEVHLKILDRFSANDDLIAYIQSPAGSRFLESAPITLDDPKPLFYGLAGSRGCAARRS